MEVYTAVPTASGGPLVRAGGLPGAVPRLPGVVLGHGERPRDAAIRALPPVPGGSLTPGDLRLVRVLSDLRPRSETAGVGLHVLRLIFGAAPSWATDVDPEALRDPDPAPPTVRLPGAPPQVQRPAAYAVVVQGGRALLSRVTGHGVWTLPGGGIDHGEHPDDAVRRETIEETGLRLASAELLDADGRHFTGRGPNQVLEDFHAVRILYRGTVEEDRQPQVQEVGGSTDAAAWVPLDRLRRLRLNDLARSLLLGER